MILEIKAIRYKTQSLISPLAAIFNEAGGSIGRSSANHLVLADEEKVVSSKHALIQFEDGCFYYIDKSTNGTWFIQRDQWVHHEKIKLQDQEQLSIGDYDIVIAVSKEAPEIQSQPFNSSFFATFGPNCVEENGPSSGPSLMDKNNAISVEKDRLDKQTEFADTGENDFPALSDCIPPPVIVHSSKKSSDSLQDLSLEDFFDDEKQLSSGTADDSGKALTNMESQFRKAQEEALHQQEIYHQADVLTPPEVKGFDKSKPDQRSSDEEKNSNEMPAAVSSDVLEVFFKALGITDSTVLPKEHLVELMQTAGHVIRELVDGLMTILRGRTEQKSQFRVSVTTIKKVENNPLKFSPTSKEALKALLINKPSGFLTAVDAIHEGFEDIKNHQLAITAGIQASLIHILSRFDPIRFEKKYEEGIIIQKKTKCWNEYRQSYHQMVEEAIEGFFGEAFVQAYEAQSEKLRSERKK